MAKKACFFSALIWEAYQLAVGGEIPPSVFLFALLSLAASYYIDLYLCYREFRKNPLLQKVVEQEIERKSQ